MARPTKKGIDYFQADVDMFQDRKIKRLLRSSGSKGFTVYIYLLTCIYRDEGYLYEWDEHSAFDISDDLNFSESVVEESVRACCSIGLFNEDLYSAQSILTSESIQERWSKIVKDANRSQTEIEHEHLIIDGVSEFLRAEKGLSGEETPQKSEETPQKSRKSTQSKVKESKEEESKEKNNRASGVPSWEEFWQYAESKAYHPDYAKHLYDSRLSEGWRRDNGNFIEDWKAYLNMSHKYQRSWLQRQKELQSNTNTNGKNRKQSSRDFAEKLDRLEALNEIQ